MSRKWTPAQYHAVKAKLRKDKERKSTGPPPAKKSKDVSDASSAEGCSSTSTSGILI